MKNIPKLRLPEFRDAPERDEKPLDKLLTIGSGRDYKHLSNGDIPVYGSGGYMLSVDDYLYYAHSFKDCILKFIYSCF